MAKKTHVKPTQAERIIAIKKKNADERKALVQQAAQRVPTKAEKMRVE